MKKIFFIITVIIMFMLSSSIIYADEYMTDSEEKQFLCFLYNDKDASSEKAGQLQYDRFYTLLTGGYKDNKDEEQKNEILFLMFVNSQINNNIKSSEYKQANLNELLIKMATQKLDSSKDLSQEIIEGEVNRILGDVQDGLKSYLVNAIDNYAPQGTDVKDAVDILAAAKCGWESGKGTANKVNKFYEACNTAIAGVWYVQNFEFTARYTYFSCYMNLLKQSSPGDPDFDILADYNFFAIKHNYPASAIVSFVPGKKAWYECRDTIERWAEYTYNLKSSLYNELPDISIDIGTTETTTETTT